MQSTLEAVRREALRRGAAHVRRVVLRIGALSGVEPEALRFAFAELTPGGIAEGAELEIEHLPALARCPECTQVFPADRAGICLCPHCGAMSGDLRQGRELELQRIEFTTPTP